MKNETPQVVQNVFLIERVEISLKSDHPVQTIGYWSYNKTLIQIQNSKMNINRSLLSDGNMR